MVFVMMANAQVDPAIETTGPAGPPAAATAGVVCHVVHALDVGGAELLARQFAFHHRGSYRSVFGCLDAAGSMAAELGSEGFAVEWFERRPGFDLRCARRLARFCRSQHVDLLHAHQYAPFLYSATARLFGLRLPILFHEHGRDWPDYRRRKRVLANRLLLRRCDRIVAVGEHVRRALIEHEGLPPERIQVIYNGVELARYDFERPRRGEVRAELKIGAEEIAVMQVARLNRLKDQSTALRAIGRLIQQQPRLRLLLVGAGEDRPAIERLIAELELGSRVSLLGSRNDVPRLLQGADLFLLTSISEGIPLTLIEAMATGLPCVTTRVGGTPEVVADGETGLLATSGSSDDVARQLHRLSNHPELRQRMGIAGRRRAETLFDDRRMHAAYQRIYAEMLGSEVRGR